MYVILISRAYDHREVWGEKEGNGVQEHRGKDMEWDYRRLLGVGGRSIIKGLGLGWDMV